MRKRGLCCRPVSVRPSLCAPSFYFLTPSDGTQFQGESPSAGAHIIHGVGKFAIFDRNPKSPFISETVKNVNRKS